jgi:hypoxanthine phosphoribosyltransferase
MCILENLCRFVKSFIKMKKIKIRDKTFEAFISAEKIEEAVERIAAEIKKDNKNKNPLFISILNGSFMFAGDLLKKLNIDCDISFVKYSSYKGMRSQLKVKKLLGVNEDIRDRNVIIIEDIIDTGITIETLLNDLNEFQPASIKITGLLFKPDAFIKKFKIDYKGFDIPNIFVVGYGLDYDGKGRNYPEIYKCSH